MSKIAVALAFAVISMCHADERSGTIQGSVRGRDGATLEEARVTIFPGGKQTATKKDGSFLCAGLEPGRYLVVVFHADYHGWALPDVSVKAGQIATLRIRLQAADERDLVIYENATAAELASSTAVLEVLGEPALCSPKVLAQGGESYRFLWLRSFHHPVVIHILIPPSGVPSLTYKESDGRGGDDYGHLVKNVTLLFDGTRPMEMTGDQLRASFLALADELFWKLPYRAIDPDLLGVDGATWTVEGVRGDRCHVASKWAPSETDDLRRFAEVLLRLTHQPFSWDEVY